jgi:glycosyltransferase involved in cell wall biosynthesis
VSFLPVRKATETRGLRLTPALQQTKRRKRYVLVTAACNEERYIERVIGSVISQSVRPLRWIIVSDCSTDRTDEIVQKYAEQFEFIHLLRMTDVHDRNFAAQVNAINCGFARMCGTDYDFIGNLDSDVSFEPAYFETLLGRFDLDERLGLAGGDICEEHHGEFKPRKMNHPQSVAHAVQLFRRECFEELGGYVPLPYGGPDWHANVRCRMNGWHVQAFTDLKVFHYRPTGGAGGWVRSFYRQGLMAFSMGSHPMFEIARSVRRFQSRPYILGGLVRLVGFAYAHCRGEKRAVSKEFVKFLRQEELQRLWLFACGRSGSWGITVPDLDVDDTMGSGRKR